MKDQRKNTRKQNEKNNNKPAKKGLLNIGKTLGIAIPAGLLLFISPNAGASTQAQNIINKETFNTAKKLDNLKTNEIVQHVRSMKDNIILAQIHANTHVDDNSPNVTNADGTHGNVHSNYHTDYTRE